MKNLSRANISGFTLIELLVVVLLIGILSAVALPQYQKAVDKSKFSEAQIILKSLGNAQKICKLEKGEESEECDELENLVLDFPFNPNGSYTFETKDFLYTTVGTASRHKPTAWYKKYDVCICWDEENNKFVGSNSGSHCGDQETPYDVLKMLGIEDVGNQCWMC